MNNNLPFEEILENGYYIRIFDEKTNADEFVWHRDKEDRILESLHETDWKFQIDDQLPINFDKKIFIQAEKYHRLIKGNGNLKIKIKKII
jgi:hypothetical protein